MGEEPSIYPHQKTGFAHACTGLSSSEQWLIQENGQKNIFREKFLIHQKWNFRLAGFSVTKYLFG